MKVEKVRSLAVRPGEGSKIELVLCTDLGPAVFEIDEPKLRLIVIDLFNAWVRLSDPLDRPNPTANQSRSL
jgi:hypothetical protein